MVCMLGMAGFWQSLAQRPVAVSMTEEFEALLGTALAPLLGLLTPLALACVVILQARQLRAGHQQLAHARYECAVETALCQRRTSPPVSPPAARAAPRLRRVDLAAANEPDFLSTGKPSTKPVVQRIPLSTPAAVRAIAAAIAVCETRLSDSADEVYARELQLFMYRLHRRLQLLKREMASADHE